MAKRPIMSVEAERRAIVALFAIFALLVQALIPSFAVAAARADDGAMMICTNHGLQTAPVDDGAPAQPAPGHPCEHCVCPAAVAPPPAISIVGAVRYAYAHAAPPPARERLTPPARGPPPPPGQGPPPPYA
jgi:hypothetical protein